MYKLAAITCATCLRRSAFGDMLSKLSFHCRALMLFNETGDSDVNGIPSWAKNFADAVGACFNEIGGSMAGFDYQYSGPGTQAHNDHLILFAPQPLEIAGGAEDGEVVVEPMSVDIQSVQRLFTELESTTYHAAIGDAWHLRRHVALVGYMGKRSISVYIYDEPLDDAEIRTVLDERSKSFRSKRKP